VVPEEKSQATGAAKVTALITPVKAKTVASLSW
jgi:hypothetical protein